MTNSAFSPFLHFKQISPKEPQCLQCGFHHHLRVCMCVPYPVTVRAIKFELVQLYAQVMSKQTIQNTNYHHVSHVQRLHLVSVILDSQQMGAGSQLGAIPWSSLTTQSCTNWGTYSGTAEIYNFNNLQ